MTSEVEEGPRLLVQPVTAGMGVNGLKLTQYTCSIMFIILAHPSCFDPKTGWQSLRKWLYFKKVN